MGAPPGRPLGTAFFVFAARVGKHERRVPQVSILKPGIAQSSTHEITRSETYSIFGIGVDRKHALKWLFPQGKATFHCFKKVYEYSENALDVAACLPALLEIALVILLSAPEGLRRLYLGHNPLRFELARSRQLLNLGFGLRLLLRRVEEDGRAVLCAPVRPLAIQRR